MKRGYIVAAFDMKYAALVQDILQQGVRAGNRTGIDTTKLFGVMLRQNLTKEGAPILSLRKLNPYKALIEACWMLRGESNIRFLLERDCHFWDEWGFNQWIASPVYDGPNMTNYGIRRIADAGFAEEVKVQMKRYCEKVLTDDEFALLYGDMGRVYGNVWRHFKGDDGKEYDQLATCIDTLKNNPQDRRIIISAWDIAAVNNPDIPCALPSCIDYLQWDVNPESNQLNLNFHLRSSDIYIGLPADFISYAGVLTAVAAVTGYDVGDLVYTAGNTHVYANHIDSLRELIQRNKTEEAKELPQSKIIVKGIHTLEDLNNIDIDNFQVLNYEPLPPIKGGFVAV